MRRSGLLRGMSRREVPYVTDQGNYLFLVVAGIAAMRRVVPESEPRRNGLLLKLVIRVRVGEIGIDRVRLLVSSSGFGRYSMSCSEFPQMLFKHASCHHRGSV